MSDVRGTEQHIRPVAKESLETFEKIAKAAEANLQSGASGSSPTSIVRNTFTEQEAIRTHNRITQENLEGNRILSREPAIARVVVADENGQKTTYYFSRAAAAPLRDKRLKFASYRSRVGRLAELGIGDEYTSYRATASPFPWRSSNMPVSSRSCRTGNGTRAMPYSKGKTTVR